MKSWRMAARNIMRAKRRSFITVAAMALALGIMTMYDGLMEGLLLDMKRIITEMEMGDIQIHHPEYRVSPSLYKQVPEPEKLIAQLKEKGYRASYRLFATGLAAKDNSSSAAILRGVDATLEDETLELPEHLLAGKWLDAADPNGVVLGKKLAKSLNAKVDDQVVIVSQAADGSLANDLFKVRGVLKSVGDGLDRGGFYMNAATFRDLMVMEQGAHEIIVSLPKDVKLTAAAAQIKTLVPNMEVATWKQISPALAEMLDIWEVMLIPMTILVYVAVGIVILNAMLMAVFERIREYGVMKALGVGPWSIFMLVLMETLLMTLAAVVLGEAFGIPGLHYLQNTGLDLATLGNGEGLAISGIAMDPVWRGALTARVIAIPLISLIVLALLAAVYPAMKAARLNPVDAMHHQ